MDSSDVVLNHEDEVAAFIAFVEGNPKALMMVEEESVVKKIVHALAQKGESPARILARLSVCPVGAVVVGEFLQALRGEAWIKVARYLEAQCELDEEVRRVNLLDRMDPFAQAISAELETPVAIRALLKGAPELVCSNRSLIGRLDAYWVATFQHFLEVDNFKRAWDTIRQAHSGLMRRDLTSREEMMRAMDPVRFAMDPGNRCHALPLAMVRTMVSELHAKMTRLAIALPDVEGTSWRRGDPNGSAWQLFQDMKAPETYQLICYFAQKKAKERSGRRRRRAEKNFTA